MHHGAGHGKDRRKGFTETDYARLLDAAHQQLTGPLVVVWDNLKSHVSAAMVELIAARDWLTVYQLPPYAHELNPVELVWSHLKRSLANLAKRNLNQLTALVKTRLKRKYLFKQASLRVTGSGRPGWSLHRLRHSALTHLGASGRTAVELQAKAATPPCAPSAATSTPAPSWPPASPPRPTPLDAAEADDGAIIVVCGWWRVGHRPMLREHDEQTAT